ncbi:MAG TPA: hypothetical protein VLA00_12835 [Xanthobacteraceae bacterium]|nr:hypothetical protein [Xanthobacteraceae bacterium]
MSQSNVGSYPARPRGVALADLVRAWQSISLTRACSIVLFASLGIWVLLVFRDYGISNDEPVQHTYGELLWAWYASGFADTRAFHYENLFLYGGLFDLAAVFLSHHMPFQTYETRHLLSAGFGLAGLFAVWRLAKLLGGEKAGIAAVLMLAFTGMYGGAMFTHTKDVPFAASMVWSLYYITRIAVRLPELPSTTIAVKLGVAVGCALGLRVGGVFAIAYLGATLLAAAVLLSDVRMLGRAIVRLLPAAPVALTIMALTWPWSVLAPTNILDAMSAFSNFAFRLTTLLDGQRLPIDQVPGTYMLDYLLVKLPEITLLGTAAAALFAVPALLRDAHWRRRCVSYLPLALSVLVPVVFTLAERPPLYNGIRHFLFVLPPVTVIAALGLRSLWHWVLRRPFSPRALAAVVAGALFLFNAVQFVRLHPYQYAGYNQLAGGFAAANGRYEGDYWSDSLREATIALNRKVREEGRLPAHPYHVAVCAETPQVATYLGPALVVTEDWSTADFFITALNIECDNVVPGGVYLTVSRMGVPLAEVKDLRGLPREPAPPVPDVESQAPPLPGLTALASAGRGKP